MGDTFPWQQKVFKICEGGNAVLALDCRRNFLNMISEILFFFYSRYLKGLRNHLSYFLGFVYIFQFFIFQELGPTQ